jgi:predicted transcriptional regulator
MDLDDLAKQIHDGGESPSVSVREFLSWFGARRRGFWIVREIREALAAANLRTIPDFETEWIDSEIEFELRTSKVEAKALEAPVSIGIAIDGPSDTEDETVVWVTREATYRISRLDAANKEIVFCAPDEPIASVVTKMLKGGFSQLPVMTGERTIKGIVTWQTIGSHFALGAAGKTAKEMMEPHQEISNERSIFDAIPTIVSNDYVLVKDGTGLFTGIITAADLSLQFRELTEPFLLLSEIENIVRNLIGQNFELEELRASCDSKDEERLKKSASVAHLYFAEYVRLIENEDRWAKLGLPVDRKIFCKDLDDVSEIRNDVMHFDPDGVDPESLAKLREFTRFLQKVATITKVYEV